jgi:L-lactate dehydrogenase complex protein LldE
VDTFRPRVAEAAVRVLRHLGCRVRYPAEQTCCGQPAYNSGFLDEAGSLAARMADIFDGEDAVVTMSASCAGMVREHAAEVVGREGKPAVERLARRTVEIVAFLRDELRVDPATYRGLIREPAVFHYSCHLRGAETVTSATAIVRDMAGPFYRELENIDECCGFGGVFCVNHPAISVEMAEQKLAAIDRSGARLVVCNEAGCGLHLEGVARRTGRRLRFAHVVELLAEGWRLMEPVRE